MHEVNYYFNLEHLPIMKIIQVYSESIYIIIHSYILYRKNVNYKPKKAYHSGKKIQVTKQKKSSIQNSDKN